MGIKYFRERVHCDVKIIFFDGTGLFMELIIVTSKTVNGVDQCVNNLSRQGLLFSAVDLLVIQIAKSINSIVKWVPFQYETL